MNDGEIRSFLLFAHVSNDEFFRINNVNILLYMSENHIVANSWIYTGLNLINKKLLHMRNNNFINMFTMIILLINFS